MRIPAVIERYCLSICSGDFNEWVRKNASVQYPGSYMFAPEYEIFEWDLGGMEKTLKSGDRLIHLLVAARHAVGMS